MYINLMEFIKYLYEYVKSQFLSILFNKSDDNNVARIIIINKKCFVEHELYYY